MAGASRLARLEAIERRIDPVIAAVAAGVAAPLVVGFVSWVLQSAEAAGIRRLFFLSRDGEVLHDIACLLQADRGLQVDCRYIHVSRRSMGLSRAGIPAPRGPDPSLLRDYLIDSGLGDEVATGVVDVGWRGNTSRVLTEQVIAAGGRIPAAYYNVGLSDDAADVAGPLVASRQYGWLFDRMRGGGMPDDILGQVALVEMFTTATHGPVVAYRRSPEGVEPVLASERDRVALDWGLNEVRWVVNRFAEHMASQSTTVVAPDTRTAVWSVLRLFWEEPTDVEVKTWGSFPMDFDALERVGTIAQRIETTEGIWSLSLGHGNLRPHESWLMATARRSAPPITLLLRGRHWWHRHGPRLRRIRGRVMWELASRSEPAARVARWMNAVVSRQ
jgi:hypothetical protein